MSINRSRIRLKRNGRPANHVRPTAGRFLSAAPRSAKSERPVLITGGAGFIGTNLAHRLLLAGKPVLLYDNLSRPGVERNVAWLRATHGDLVELMENDVRDATALQKAVLSWLSPINSGYL